MIEIKYDRKLLKQLVDTHSNELVARVPLYIEITQHKVRAIIFFLFTNNNCNIGIILFEYQTIFLQLLP